VPETRRSRSAGYYGAIQLFPGIPSLHSGCAAAKGLPRCRTVKTLAIEDIYADPHKLDSYLESGESVEILRDGRTVAELAPRKVAVETGAVLKRPHIDLRARFLKMWGPDAFRSPISVGEEFAELRRARML
jgi:hypothetical protein